MRDPIKEMEIAAREQLPTLYQQGVYLCQEPAVIGGVATAVALVAWAFGAPAWVPLTVAGVSVLVGVLWIVTR